MAERENKVRDRAYALWQAEGEPHGRDRDHWTQAELELGDDDSAAAEPADSPAADTPLTDTQDTAPAAEPADSPAAPKPRATPARKPRKPRAKQA